jgi:hypothetical protein
VIFWLAAALVGVSLSPLFLLAWLFLLIAPRTFERAMLATFEHLDINQEDAPEELYIRRFYLTPKTWKRKIFLHRICRSDRDRDAHSHQWNFWSFIMKGEYLEHVFHPNACGCGDIKCRYRYEQRRAPAGTLLRNKAEHTHWVQIVKPVWSLVFIGVKRINWGFWIMGKHPHPWSTVIHRRGLSVVSDKVPPDRFVPWDEYLASTRIEQAAAGETAAPRGMGEP